MSAEAAGQGRIDLGLKANFGQAMQRDEAEREEQSPHVRPAGLRDERQTLRAEGPSPNHLILHLCDAEKGLPFLVWNVTWYLSPRADFYTT